MVEPMKTKRSYFRVLMAGIVLAACASTATAQTDSAAAQPQDAAAAPKLDMSKLTHEQIANVQVASVAERLLAMYRQSRSEEHTSELQSLMRLSYAVF